MKTFPPINVYLRTAFCATFRLLPLFLILFSINLQAQTKGLIIKPSSVAGKAVLDPNLDGYTSLTDGGFVVSDETESEISFVKMVLPQPEPTSDVATGPDCGFTDFVDAPGLYSSAYYALQTDGPDTNFLFRFRLGNYAPNSKGYSVLIDTDGKFGNTGSNADPNYVAGNPGFELEIILVTNHGVRLYNVDGSATATLLTTIDYDDHAQISVALSENCSNNDYFYDFYMPLWVIQAHVPGFYSSTAVRMVPNTVINTQSAIGGNVSDMGGFDNESYGPNTDKAWIDFVTLTVPSSLEDAGTGFPDIRTLAPVVTGPISSNNITVSGTSSEPDGTSIQVYKNSVLMGTTTVSGGNWTLAGVSGLALNDTISATATASGKSVSLFSNKIIVGSVCSSAPATIDCQGRKGFGGTGPSGAAAGTAIRIYGPDNPNTLIATVYTDALNAWIYNCNNSTTCNGGSNCLTSGTYFISAQESGNCESVKIPVCVGITGGNSVSDLPVISTNPITPSTTSITGTATAGATVYLYKNGLNTSSTTATGGNWSFASQTFILGQYISIKTIESGKCISDSASRSVTATTVAPVVTSTLVHGVTSVSGTSTEASGTVIYIYKNGSLTDSTTVDAYGNWTKSGLIALITGQTIKATAKAPGKTISGDSNTVTVLGLSTAPVIIGSYLEGGTSVSGTSGMANGTVIKVYIDGVLIGTTTVTSGSWTLSGLSPTDFDLYSGGTLTAIATGTGLGESTHSAGDEVDCNIPSGSLSLDVLSDSSCINTRAEISVLGSQQGVIYTLKSFDLSTDKGSSMLGDGLDKVLSTVVLTKTESYKVLAMRLPQESCTNMLTNTVSVPVKVPEDLTGLTSDDYLWLGSSGDSTWSVAENWIRWNGSEFETVQSPPVETNNVVIKPIQSCINNIPFVVTSMSASTPSECHHIKIDVGGVLAMDDTENDRALIVKGNWTNLGTFLPNKGTVIFNGETEQEIFSASGAENFNNLRVEGNTTTVKLLVDVATGENGLIELEAGIINLNEKTLTVNNPSPAAVVRTTGMVISESQNGKSTLYRKIGSNTGVNYLFPVGKDTGKYLPVTMKLNSGNIGMAGVATYFSALTDTSTWPKGSEKVTSLPVPERRVKRFWHLETDALPGSFSVNVNFSFASNEVPPAGINNTGNDGVTMRRYNISVNQWDEPLPVQTYTHSSKTLLVEGITGFSWWGGNNNDGAALPVELISFEGKCIDDQVNFTWTTASEIDSEKFDLMRSADGKTYENIGTVGAARYSITNKNYALTDYNPLSSTAYYKLVQTDLNGDFEEFPVKSVKCDRNMLPISIYPNPAAKQFSVSSAKEILSVEIYDIRNMLILRTEVEPALEVPINVEDLTSGLYIVFVNTGDVLEKKKLIINR